MVLDYQQDGVTTRKSNITMVNTVAETPEIPGYLYHNWPSIRMGHRQRLITYRNLATTNNNNQQQKNKKSKQHRSNTEVQHSAQHALNMKHHKTQTKNSKMHRLYNTTPMSSIRQMSSTFVRASLAFFCRLSPAASSPLEMRCAA